MRLHGTRGTWQRETTQGGRFSVLFQVQRGPEGSWEDRHGDPHGNSFQFGEDDLNMDHVIGRTGAGSTRTWRSGWGVRNCLCPIPQLGFRNWGSGTGNPQLFGFNWDFLVHHWAKVGRGIGLASKMLHVHMCWKFRGWGWINDRSIGSMRMKCIVKRIRQVLNKRS